MKVIYIFLCYIIHTINAFSEQEICDSNEILYREMHCTLVEEGLENGCPHYYNCDEFFKRELNFCYSNGEQFQVGESLPQKYYVKHHPCITDCYCTFHIPNEVNFVCSTVECPEDQYYNCRKHYNLTSCCGEEICNDNKLSIKTCEYDNVNVYLGERFYTQTKQCLCTEQYDGTLSDKWCRNVSCNYELQFSQSLLRQCIPIYYNRLNGCAVNWRCYDEDVDTISEIVRNGVLITVGNMTVYDSTKMAPSIATPRMCTFGGLIFNLGDKLLLSKPGSLDLCVECVCYIPPLLTCLRCTLCEDTLPQEIRVQATWDFNSARYYRSHNFALFICLIVTIYTFYSE